MGFRDGAERTSFCEPLALNALTTAKKLSMQCLMMVLQHSALGGMVLFMPNQDRLTLQKAIAKVKLHRAEAGEKPISMNSLAVQCGVSATTITRLTRPADDPKTASALSLDLAGKILTVLDCRIEDPLEAIVDWIMTSINSEDPGQEH